MADIIGIAAGALTFAGLVGGYAYLSGLRTAADRLAAERLARETAPRRDEGRAIGGHNRPGAN